MQPKRSPNTMLTTMAKLQLAIYEQIRKDLCTDWVCISVFFVGFYFVLRCFFMHLPLCALSRWSIVYWYVDVDIWLMISYWFAFYFSNIIAVSVQFQVIKWTTVLVYNSLQLKKRVTGTSLGCRLYSRAALINILLQCAALKKKSRR